MTTKIHAVILAGGKGTRINARAIPKVLYPLNGRPMVGYVIDTLKKIGITKPIMVIGFQGQKVRETFGDRVSYVWQRKRLGTGHAVLQAKSLLAKKSGYTFVLNGDNPFFSGNTLRSMEKMQANTRAAIVIAACELPKQYAYGRVILDKDGFVQRIVEQKNATEAEQRIRLKNAGAYLFDNQWLWQTISILKKDIISGEYYITDLIALAVGQGKRVAVTIIDDPHEAVGVNTHENLQEAERVAKGERVIH